MLKEVILVANLADDVLPTTGDFVGIDKGAFILAERGIHMEFAIGDFDSITETEKRLVKAFAKEIIQLNPMKDDSDSQVAIKECIQRGYTKGYLYGALGGRLDHQYVNQQLCMHDEFDCTLVNRNNRIFTLKVGEHIIHHDNFDYCSFFAVEDAIVTLKGFKYPLQNYSMKQKNLIGLSNEIIDDCGSVEVHQGKLLCIQSK